MTDPVPPAGPLVVPRSRALKGRFRVPGEPLLAALATLLAAIARGETVIYADATLPGPDLAAALRLVAALGACVEPHEDRFQISGLGALGLLEPVQELHLAGAPRTLPLALGLLAAYRFPTRLAAGDAEAVPAVPRGLAEGLRLSGASLAGKRTGYLPLTLSGPSVPMPFALAAPAGLSNDEVVALLLTGLGLPGVSVLGGLAAVPDRALALFRHFGAEIVEGDDAQGRTLSISGLATLGARTLALPGDPAVAALVMVAALVVPESDVVVENVPLAPGRLPVHAVLVEMGGRIEVRERRQVLGEAVGDLRVRHSPLLGTQVAAAGLGPADLLPLAVAAAYAAGETVLPRLGHPGESESYRHLAGLLAGNGARTRLDSRGLSIVRPGGERKLGGGTLGQGEAALTAAAVLVLGLGAGEAVTLADERELADAYPQLLAGLGALGAEFYRGRLT